MRRDFAYRNYGVMPSGGRPAQVVYRPEVNLWVKDKTLGYEVTSLVDTGADVTIFPMRYCDNGLIDPVFDGIEEKFVAGNGGPIRVRYGAVNLILDNGPQVWGSRIGFSEDRQDAVFGVVGFLEHFRAMFDWAGRRLTLLGKALPPRHDF